MAYHSNMHMIIGSQQMVAMACKEEEKENIRGARKESKRNTLNQTKKTGQTHNLFVNLIRKQFGEKKSFRQEASKQCL